MCLDISCSKDIRVVAFDLGGVLAYCDDSTLSEEELYLLQLYKKFMSRQIVFEKDRSFLEYAKSKMSDIYLKIHKLNNDTIPVLEMLQDEKIRTSIWTNNTPYINSWLEEVGLIRFIHSRDIINSFYLGYDKPDIRFYLEALNILNINPLSVLFLDDNNTNVESAKRCGICGEQYTMQMSLYTKVKDMIRIRK